MPFVRFVSDPSEVLGGAREFLDADLVRNERIASLLVVGAKRGRPVRCWWAEDGGETLGVVAEGGLAATAEISVLAPQAVGPLAEALAAAEPTVDRFRGSADDVVRLGERLAQLRHCAGRVGARRLGLEVRQVDSVAAPPGGRRLAVSGDEGALVAWMHQFDLETDTAPDDDFNRAVIRSYTQRGRLHLWQRAGERVASIAVYDPDPRVARLVFVYSPPEHRGHGFAARLVAEVSADLLASGSRCLLYADPSTPAPMKVYERVGFRQFSEIATWSCARSG